MFNILRDKTVSLRVTVLSMFLLVVCITVSLVLGLQFYFSCDLAKTAAEKSFLGISEKVSERIHALDRQSANIVNMLGSIDSIEDFSDSFQNCVSLPLLSSAMKDAPNYYAVYIGCDNGDFFEVINLESSESVRREIGAAPVDRWVAIRIYKENGKRIKVTSFIDADMKVRFSTKEAGIYDPSTRPWFLQAAASKGIIKTSPYMFSYLHSPGVTYARAVNNGHKVVAVDISLASMTRFLKNQRLIPNSKVFLFQENGDVTAEAAEVKIKAEKISRVNIDLNAEEKEFLAKTTTITASNELNWPPFDFAMRGSPRGYSIDLLNLLAGKIGLKVKYVNGFDWDTLVKLFQKGELDLLHSLFDSPERQKMGIFTPEYLRMPQIAVTKKGVTVKSLAELKGKKVAIPKGWATAKFLKKNYPDIRLHYVKTSLDALKAVMAGKAYATVDSAPVFKFLQSAYFLKSLKLGPILPELNVDGGEGLHFLVRPEKAVLAGLLTKVMNLLTDEDYKKLDEKWLSFSMGTEKSNLSTQMGSVPYPEFLTMTKDVGLRGRLKTIKLDGKKHFVYVSRLQSLYGHDEYLGFIVPLSSTLKPYMEKVRFSVIATLCLLIFFLPLVMFIARLIVNPIKALMGESIKVKERRYNEVVPVSSNITEIVDLSAHMVAMSESISEYENATHELMDSFIRLIATAIDHKSPYTGGHCERVPELAMMIGKAANENSDEAFAGFNLSTDDEWREFRVAAWLHDCGKVTTPEYIVDKATKLETIYNRIHEIRMRFEVLLRDAEVDYWRDRCVTDSDVLDLRKTLLEKQQEIRDDFAFIAECNEGSEFMDNEKIERIHKISEKTWVRYLDDRLGLGHLEKLRYPADEPELPHEEKLLSDRPEHIIERFDSAVKTGSEGRFAMKPPENMYNLGEVYNLCIQKGTLTPEDRYKINEHIIATIVMLEELPYPSNLTKIPEYAGAHHETLAGTGYPRKLKGDQISMPGRILALSDVFEALTASDRPYKKAKSLSEALDIMILMVKDQHLDADVFRLFLETGIYKEYTMKFLAPEQIDQVDINKYLKEL